MTLIEHQFILFDLRCDSVLFCVLFPPLSPVCFRFTIRPLAPNLPTGPCEPHCCQVTSLQETNPSCQCPASTTNTPELGHVFHSSPRQAGPPVSTDCCAEVQEDWVIYCRTLCSRNDGFSRRKRRFSFGYSFNSDASLSSLFLSYIKCYAMLGELSEPHSGPDISSPFPSLSDTHVTPGLFT